ASPYPTRIVPESSQPVTTPLSIAPTPFAGATATGRTSEASAGFAFGGVLDAEMGASGDAIRTAFHAARGAETPLARTGTALAGDLDTLLAQLADHLAALEDSLGDDQPLDP